jgi:hypothetical protein
MLSGQAEVGVIFSAVQLISATTSLHISKVVPSDGVAETKSARLLFFGISATFMFVCGAANAWMMRLPSYRVVVPNDAPWIRRRLSISQNLGSPVLCRRSTSIPDSKALWGNIFSVARRNIIYEVYVFMITLVSHRARSLECPT